MFANGNIKNFLGGICFIKSVGFIHIEWEVFGRVSDYEELSGGLLRWDGWDQFCDVNVLLHQNCYSVNVIPFKDVVPEVHSKVQVVPSAEVNISPLLLITTKVLFPYATC